MCAQPKDEAKGQGITREVGSGGTRGTNVRGEGHEPDTRCGTVGASGHAGRRRSGWGVLITLTQSTEPPDT